MRRTRRIVCALFVVGAIGGGVSAPIAAHAFSSKANCGRASTKGHEDSSRGESHNHGKDSC